MLHMGGELLTWTGSASSCHCSCSPLNCPPPYTALFTLPGMISVRTLPHAPPPPCVPTAPRAEESAIAPCTPRAARDNTRASRGWPCLCVTQERRFRTRSPMTTPSFNTVRLHQRADHWDRRLACARRSGTPGDGVDLPHPRGGVPPVA